MKAFGKGILEITKIFIFNQLFIEFMKLVLQFYCNTCVFFLQMLEAFLPDMIERNHGHVVALSSMAGVLGLTNLVPYCASKFAVRGNLFNNQTCLDYYQFLCHCCS